ncbi:MAG: outer membrane protein assembly factor BamC [Pseudomonadota bacterium]
MDAGAWRIGARKVTRRVGRPALILAVIAGLGGCGYLFGDKGVFRDGSKDYRRAEELPPLQLPPGRKTESIAEIYAIPKVTSEATLDSGDDVPRPAPLVAASADQLVRIQSLGDDSWVLVAIAPGQLWPQLRSFMNAANIDVARMDARAGIIESPFLELTGKERQARFRFRIERGVQRGNSELHVLQMYERSEPGWPPQSDDLDIESEMLRGVAQYIANSADTAPVSMMAEQSMRATSRVALVDAGGESPYIDLELPFDRAWASLARSLELSGFEISDRNRSQGEYYATYRGDPDEKEGGWFSWLGSGDDEHPAEGVPLLIAMNTVDERRVEIRLAPETDPAALAARDREALLVLIKGNIN